MGRIRDFLNVFNNSSVLLLVRSRTQPEKATEVSEDEPLPVRVVGGSTGSGGGGTPTVTTTYPPQSLTVGSVPAPLTVPAGANAATVHVVSGSVRRSIGGAPSATTPTMGVGDSEDVEGAELTAYKLIRDGSSDAGLHIEYRKVT